MFRVCSVGFGLCGLGFYGLVLAAEIPLPAPFGMPRSFSRAVFLGFFEQCIT